MPAHTKQPTHTALTTLYDKIISNKIIHLSQAKINTNDNYTKQVIHHLKKIQNQTKEQNLKTIQNHITTTQTLPRKLAHTLKNTLPKNPILYIPKTTPLITQTLNHLPHTTTTQNPQQADATIFEARGYSQQGIQLTPEDQQAHHKTSSPTYILTTQYHSTTPQLQAKLKKALIITEKGAYTTQTFIEEHTTP